MKKEPNAWIRPFNVAYVLGLAVCLACGLDKESSLRKEAEQGSIHAMYTLGQANLSTTGDGIVKRPNYRDAALWFEMGAKHGHAPSMYWLTQLGGITNEERVMWLKKGAELGNKACMVELMNGYQSGAYGLPKDIGAFLYWEACISAATRKENGKSSEEIAIEREKGEIRRRRDWNYDGPIRPLP